MAKTTKATVTLPVGYTTLNVRETPDGKVVGTLPNGEAVKVQLVENGWAQLSARRFVKSEFLKFG